MKKSSPKTEQPSFDDKALAASGEEALSALKSAGDRGEALVDAWVARGNAGAVAVAAERGEGKARKAARRGLNVLKARGLKPPEAARVVHVGGTDEKEVHEAFLLAPDGAGVSLVVVASRTRSSRYKALFAYLSRVHGVVDARTQEVGRADLRESIQRALRGAKYRAVPVPVDWARSRIGSARALLRQRGLPQPFGFAGTDSLLAGASDTELPHPFDGEGLELGDEDAKELVAKSADLHALPEFRGWLPSRPAIDEMLANVGRTLPETGEPEQSAVEDALKAEILAATDRFFSPERRADLVLSIKDSALSVLAREGEGRALEIAALIKGIESCGLITDPPHDVPFLRVYFEKAIGVMLAQNQGQLRFPRPAPAPTPA
jgi:hypothetical protein